MTVFLKIARQAFSAGCFLGLLYMVVNQVTRYLQNEDSSIIKFKKLTTETYPTYSLCFENNVKVQGIYKGVSMQNSKNLSVYFDGRWLRLETSQEPNEDFM